MIIDSDTFGFNSIYSILIISLADSVPSNDV